MATTTKRLRILRELYASLPPVNCKGLCVASCSNILLAPVELLNIEKATGTAPTVVDVAGHAMLAPADKQGRCPYLVLGRCSIYDARPFVCRAFGADPAMACVHGCEPVRALESSDAREMLRAIVKL